MKRGVDDAFVSKLVADFDAKGVPDSQIHHAIAEAAKCTLSQAKQHTRHARGKCGACARDWRGRQLTCDACRGQFSERVRQRIRDRVCRACSGPTRDGRVECEACAVVSSKRSKQMRADWLAAGLCIQCGKRPRRVDSQRCFVCTDYQKAARVIYLRKALVPGNSLPRRVYEAVAAGTQSTATIAAAVKVSSRGIAGILSAMATEGLLRHPRRDTWLLPEETP